MITLGATGIQSSPGVFPYKNDDGISRVFMQEKARVSTCLVQMQMSVATVANVTVRTEYVTIAAPSSIVCRNKEMLTMETHIPA